MSNFTHSLIHSLYKWLVAQNQSWVYLQQRNWQALQIVLWAPSHQLVSIYQHPTGFGARTWIHPSFTLRDWTKPSARLPLAPLAGGGRPLVASSSTLHLRCWWWAPPGGIFKHSPSPLLLVGAPWWHLQALSISAADEACTLKRGLQGGGPLPVETENQRGGAEALPGALRGIRRPLPAQMDGVAKSQMNRSNVPHVLQPLGPHPSDVESTG